MNQTGRLGPCPDCGHLCSTDAVSCPNCGKPAPAGSASSGGGLDNSIYSQIVSQSSVNVGMCLTLLGLMKIVEGVKNVKTFADEMLAVNAIVFLLSSLASYRALKEPDPQRKLRKGRVGDMLFSVSLCLLAVICGIVAFDLM